MPHIGHVGDFDPALKSFDSYLERLDEYFIANGIGVPSSRADAAAKQLAARKKSAAYNSIIGKTAYATLSDLTKPSKRSEKTYDKLCGLLKAFYQPKTVEFAETFRFHRCIQSETESVNAFCARLSGLADK